MSEDFQSGEAGIIDMMCCASCGIKASDDEEGINLKKCAACKLVRYCDVKCQREHRPQHKRECKERAAELRDENLFRQPESSHKGDCPICCLPIAIDHLKSTTMACCSQVICDGCDCANKIGEIEQSLQHRCPFCRHPAAKTEGEVKQLRMKRAEANDPHALLPMGYDLHQEGDYGSALEYWRKAAELGNAEAHYVVSNIYWEGKGVEKDIKKAIYHLEKAAIDGHPFARYNLGCIEENNGRKDRAVKHYIIAASLGHDTSLEDLRECYAEGSVQKEDFAAALRAHQAAVDATKSLERDIAEAFYAENKEEK